MKITNCLPSLKIYSLSWFGVKNNEKMLQWSSFHFNFYAITQNILKFFHRKQTMTCAPSIKRKLNLKHTELPLVNVIDIWRLWRLEHNLTFNTQN